MEADVEDAGDGEGAGADVGAAAGAEVVGGLAGGGAGEGAGCEHPTSTRVPIKNKTAIKNRLFMVVLL